MTELKVEDRKAATKLFIDELVAKCHINSLFDVQKVSVYDLLPKPLGGTYSFIISLESNKDETFIALKLKEGKEVDSSIIDLTVSNLADFEMRTDEDFESLQIQFSGDEAIRSIQSTMNIIGKEKLEVVVRKLFIIK